MSELFKKPINKAKALCTAASVATVTTVTMPFAMAEEGTIDPETIVGKVLNIVFDIFFYIGILLLAWAIGMLVLAFKNEDADSKSRAMMMLIVAIALVGLRALFGPISEALGITISDDELDYDEIRDGPADA